MPIDMLDKKSVAEEFRKNFKRTWHVPSVRLTNVDRALSDYLKSPSTGNLQLLINMVAAWKTDGKGKEYKNCNGSLLLDAIEMWAADADTTGVGRLQDGDILFRFLPHNIGQRQGKHWLISGLQGLTALTQGTGTGWNWDVIIHAAVYVENAVYTGVKEIDGTGLASYPVDHRDHAIDLVVRCDDKEDGHDIGRVAARAKALMTRHLGFIDLGKGVKTFPLGPGQDEKAIYPYPLTDFVNLALSRCKLSIFTDDTLDQLQKLNHKYIQNREDVDEMAQSVVCSHFVHAVLYTAARPDVVTLRAATSHELDKVFKIGPSQLWQNFHYHGGIFDILPAHFVGIEQDGILYPMEEKDLGSKTVGLAAA